MQGNEANMQKLHAKILARIMAPVCYFCLVNRDSEACANLEVVH